MHTLLGKKLSQSQMFLENGFRIPVTHIQVEGNVVVGVKSNDKDKYSALKLGFGMKKNPSKARKNIAKKASLKITPYSIREVRLTDLDSASAPRIGTKINATEVFKPGDVVNVIGVSKGKGYAGVVKRHHFKGGPRTHGQSDRERAPGSIGQTTTPGRVYKGKRMAGRMGYERVTIRNLRIVDVGDERISIKGLVPGSVNSLVMVKKVGEDKKFVPLYSAKQNPEVSKEQKVSEVSKGENVKTVTEEKQKGKQDAKS